MSEKTTNSTQCLDLIETYTEDKEEATLDSILVQIGQFGRFQVYIFVLIVLPMLFNALFSVTFVFTASTVVQRCNITECDGPQSQYHEPWTKFSIPQKGNDLDQCNRYINRLNENATQPADTTPLVDEEEFCLEANFEETKTEKCPHNNFIFRDREVTISNEFGIHCSQEWMLTLVGTINNLGAFLGIPVGGFISDRYGRRTALALGGFLAAIFGILRSLAPNYITFVVFEFLDHLANSTLYPTCCIMAIELVGPHRRVIVCCILTIFYSIGEILMAVIAKYFQNWRLFLRILYIPALVLITYFWLLPESVRWLLSQGEEERARKTLKRAARINQRKLSDGALDKLVLANREKLLIATEGKFPIKEAFTKLFWRIANCSLCWIVHALVYYGIMLNAVLLDGDKYINFMFISLVDIPGFFLPYLIMDRLGRRYSLLGGLLISGLCCLMTIFMRTDQFGLQLGFFLLGKLIITASFQVLYFFTSEIFPTNLRNTLLSFCSMMGRVGSMLAPQTPLLAKYHENAPAVLFAICAITSACLTLFFPETANLVLPTTMHEAHNIGVKKKPIEEVDETNNVNRRDGDVTINNIK